MASTTNLNLTKLTGTEKQKTFPSPYNDNMDAIDGAFGADFGVSGKPSVNSEINSLGDGLAILANGNTHAAITSGQFVYVRGHGTLADGLYQATSNIAQDGTLSGSNLTADSAGGLNTVYSTLNSKLTTIGAINTGTNISASVSCASGTVTEVSEITLAIGTWLVIANVTWGANETGYRQIAFDDSAINPNRAKSTITGAFASKEINQQIVRIEKCTSLTTKKVYALQNSGSELNCYPYVYAIRIQYDWQ